jgi:hypothetical protein
MTLHQSARLYARWQAALARKDKPLAARLEREFDDAFYAVHPSLQPQRRRYSVEPTQPAANHP